MDKLSLSYDYTEIISDLTDDIASGIVKGNIIVVRSNEDAGLRAFEEFKRSSAFKSITANQPEVSIFAESYYPILDYFPIDSNGHMDHDDEVFFSENYSGRASTEISPAEAILAEMIKINKVI